MSGLNGSITDIPGFKVGNAQSIKGQTGCTVLLPPEGKAVAGICTHGSAPANKELDLLRIDGITSEINGVVLTGGSAYGLDSSTGVLKWLEEQGMGFDVGVARVPLVPTLSIFDLAIGDASIRPDASMGYKACKNLSSEKVKDGKTGVGTGATVGKLKGMEHCSPSGLGSASGRTGDSIVAAIGVSNAFGDIFDESGKLVAGARSENGGWLGCAEDIVEHGIPGADNMFANCTFAVVATEMKLNRKQANKVAEMAMAGMARTLQPAFTMFDFDAVLVLSCGQKKGDLHGVGTLAARLVQQALINGALAGS